MLRATRSQLEQLRAIYGHLDTISTKHSIFVVARGDVEKCYRRFLRGDLSQKQRAALYWHVKHR